MNFPSFLQLANMAADITITEQEDQRSLEPSLTKADLKWDGFWSLWVIYLGGSEEWRNEVTWDATLVRVVE